MSSSRPQGSTICVTVKSNPSQWQATAHERFTSRAMVQMMCDVMGVIPKEVEILMDQEVIVEVEDQSSIVEVSRVIQGLFHWEGQTVTVDSVVATQDLIREIVKEREVQRENKKN